jgi:hypothetical protein
MGACQARRLRHLGNRMALELTAPASAYAQTSAEPAAYSPGWLLRQ